MAQRRTYARDVVNSLAKGLAVIRAFTRQKPVMTLSEVARATGMTRASARRLLLTLVREGCARSDGRHFSLRPAILELGFPALLPIDVGELAQPALDELARKTGERCFVAMLDGEEVSYVARAGGGRSAGVDVQIGGRAPPHIVSTGRVLLAALAEDGLDRYLRLAQLKKLTPNTVVCKTKLKSLIDEARAQGWSMVDRELDNGLRSLSVPIRGRAGEVLAALNVCCPAPRIAVERIRMQLLPQLKAASAAITAALPA